MIYAEIKTWMKGWFYKISYNFNQTQNKSYNTSESDTSGLL